MQHTVEDRILQLHAKKTALVKGALDARDALKAPLTLAADAAALALYRDDLRVAGAAGTRTLRLNGIEPLAASYLFELLALARESGLYGTTTGSPKRRETSRSSHSFRRPLQVGPHTIPKNSNGERRAMFNFRSSQHPKSVCLWIRPTRLESCLSTVRGR
jgi:hypothetical protein